MTRDLEPEGVTGAAHQIPALSYPENRLLELAREVRAAFLSAPAHTPVCAYLLANLVKVTIEDRQGGRDLLKLDAETFIHSGEWVEVSL